MFEVKMKILNFIILLLVTILIVLGFFAWKNIHEENIKLSNETIKFKKITETLVRSSNRWVNKSELNNKLKSSLSKNDIKLLQNDLKKINSKLMSVGETIGKLKGKISGKEKSDRKIKVNNIEIYKDGKLIDIHEYTKNIQVKDITDNNEVKISEVRFNASSRMPWSYKVFNRKYKIIHFIGKKESGQLSFTSKLKYSINDSEYYEIPITSSKYIQMKNKNKFYWFNPILDINFVIGGQVNNFIQIFNRDNLFSIGVDLGISLSSYGETKVNSLFRLLRFGLGYDINRTTARTSFAPITLNIGRYLPVLTNLYLSPQIAVDTGGSLLLNIGIGSQI